MKRARFLRKTKIHAICAALFGIMLFSVSWPLAPDALSLPQDLFSGLCLLVMWAFILFLWRAVANLARFLETYRSSYSLRRLGFYTGMGLGLYFLLMAALFVFQGKMVFHPKSSLDLTPKNAGLEWTDLTLRSDDGSRIHAWWVPGPKGGQRGAVLFCHGNAGDICSRLESIKIFHGLGLGVLIFDYPGYGKSSGTPSEQGAYLSALAAYDYLISQKKFPPDKILVFGRSLGGAVAAWLAEKKPCAGLVLESTFTSIPDVARETFYYFPVQWLARYHFNTENRLKNISCPVLVIHSRQDDLIHFSHGEKLFAKANSPKGFLPIFGTHNMGFLVSGQLYTNGLKQMLDILPGFCPAPPVQGQDVTEEKTTKP